MRLCRHITIIAKLFWKNLQFLQIIVVASAPRTSSPCKFNDSQRLLRYPPKKWLSFTQIFGIAMSTFRYNHGLLKDMDGRLAFKGKIMWRPIFLFVITWEWKNDIFICKVLRIYLGNKCKKVVFQLCNLRVKLGQDWKLPLISKNGRKYFTNNGPETPQNWCKPYINMFLPIIGIFW